MKPHRSSLEPLEGAKRSLRSRLNSYCATPEILKLTLEFQ
ncbi:hypothetical protein NIES2098_23900 [Calothrix sp. NIES-2098]|nr:hypothetical protein NIES2098_23900 [Calothrix sp. NIES-2098]